MQDVNTIGTGVIKRIVKVKIEKKKRKKLLKLSREIWDSGEIQTVNNVLILLTERGGIYVGREAHFRGKR